MNSCYTIGCNNKYEKGSGIQFYCIPKDPDHRARWVADISYKDWRPSEFTLLCSEHFVLKSKNYNHLSPDYVPSIFNHTDSPTKQKLQKDHENFERRQALKRWRNDKPLESADDDDTRLTDLSTTELHLDSLRDIDAVLFERSMKCYDIQQEKQQNSDLRAEAAQIRGEVNILQNTKKQNFN